MTIKNIANQLATKELKDLVESIRPGLSSYYFHDAGKEVPVINVHDFSKGIIKPENIIKAKIKESAPLHHFRIVSGDVILATKGFTFKAAVVGANVNNYLISSNVVVLKLKKNILPEIIVAYLNSSEGQKALQNIAVGAVQKSITLKSLLSLKIPLPTLDIQRRLAGYFNLLSNYTALLEKEAFLRRKINDKILQNYLGGK